MKIEIFRNSDVFEASQFLCDEFFAFDISFILDLDFRLFDRFGSYLVCRDEFPQFGQRVLQGIECDVIAHQNVVKLSSLR